MNHYMLLCLVCFGSSLPKAFSKGGHFDLTGNGMRIYHDQYVTVTYKKECAARCVQAGPTCITYSTSLTDEGISLFYFFN